MSTVYSENAAVYYAILAHQCLYILGCSCQLDVQNLLIIQEPRLWTEIHRA